jgi:hypothetical protein
MTRLSRDLAEHCTVSLCALACEVEYNMYYILQFWRRFVYSLLGSGREVSFVFNGYYCSSEFTS